MSETLYETDFYAWTQEQARALRERAGRDNALDYEHLAEEVGDLGESQRRACLSQIRNILLHLLKIEYVGPLEAVDHWRQEIVGFRGELEDETSPTLQRRLTDEYRGEYGKVLKRLRLTLEVQGRRVDLPLDCPYSWDDVTGRGANWTPEPRYADPPG